MTQACAFTLRKGCRRHFDDSGHSALTVTVADLEGLTTALDGSGGGASSA